MKLRQRLALQAPDFNARLQVIESKARQLLEYSQGGAHLTFTPHGGSHVSAVEANYDWLLSDEDIENANPPELFCLLVATLCHDLLMIPAKLGKERQARATHAQNAMHFLMRNRESLGLSIHESHVIGEVIKGHGVLDFKSLDEEAVLGTTLLDLRKLSACLSMADICHADASRAPEVVFNYLELDDESAYHWRRHIQISGITRKDTRLLMGALCFSEEGARAVEAYKADIEKQLRIVSPYFKSRLRPIDGVDLKVQRLKSPLDMSLRFKSNAPAILNLLIEGVYQRNDVFIRELVQNALDACHLRRAKAMRRAEAYAPQIVLTVYRENGVLRAIRLDDNGIGMDIADIQDTVLWIGNSISHREDVKSLLSETTRTELIATFGIGLLSCFKVGERMEVRTCKEGRDAVGLAVRSITDEIRPEEAKDTTTGTTFIVELRADLTRELSPDKAAAYYFRSVDRAVLSVMELEWGEKTLEYGRDQIFRIASTQAEEVFRQAPYDDREAFCSHQVRADDFTATVWLARSDDQVRFRTDDGTVQILSEGVFVGEEPAEKWLPPHLRCCSATINFSAKAVDLPVSRDNIVANGKRSQKIEIIAEKTLGVFDQLVAMTRSLGADQDSAALAIAYLFEGSERVWKQRILRRVDGCYVRRYLQPRNLMLSDLKEAGQVYLHYASGRDVTPLVELDGKTLWHQPDDLADLQAAVLLQDGAMVLSASRVDPSRADAISEADFLTAYLDQYQVEVLDLVEEEVIKGRFRSKPVPRGVREEFSGNVKFVEVTEIPNKRAWRVGDETWINLSHPQMSRIYESLQSDTLTANQARAASALIDMLVFRFDDAINTIASMIGSKAD